MGNSWYCAHKYPPLAFDNRGNWQIWALQSNLMAEYKRKIKATGGVIISKLNLRQQESASGGWQQSSWLLNLLQLFQILQNPYWRQALWQLLIFQGHNILEGDVNSPEQLAPGKAQGSSIVWLAKNLIGPEIAEIGADWNVTLTFFCQRWVDRPTDHLGAPRHAVTWDCRALIVCRLEDRIILRDGGQRLIEIYSTGASWTVAQQSARFMRDVHYRCIHCIECIPSDPPHTMYHHPLTPRTM